MIFNSLNKFEKANVIVTFAGAVVSTIVMVASYALGDKGATLRMQQTAEKMNGYLNPPTDKT